MQTLRRTIAAVVAAACLAVPASASAAMDTAHIQSQSYWVSPSADRTSKVGLRLAGWVNYLLWADDGTADVLISLRDTLNDGWCARAYVEWYGTREGLPLRSRTVAGCSGSWTKQLARPISGSVRKLEYVDHIRVYAWSGPDMAQGPWADLMFCSPNTQFIRYVGTCANSWTYS